MAVRADHLAFLDLGQDRLPVAIGQRAADVEQLVPKVIELKDERIALSAVRARMDREVAHQVRRALERESLLLDPGLIDVPLLVREVVLALVGRPARFAERVPLSLPPATPCEVVDWLAVAASTAPESFWIPRHEHMFASAPDESSA
jgi:hypothetical protein